MIRGRGAPGGRRNGELTFRDKPAMFAGGLLQGILVSTYGPISLLYKQTTCKIPTPN